MVKFTKQKVFMWPKYKLIIDLLNHPGNKNEI